MAAVRLVFRRDQPLVWGIQPDGLAFRVSGANGNTKALNTSDLVLTDLSIADSGTYVFSTAEGCEVSLEVMVLRITSLETEIDLKKILLFPNPIPESRLYLFLGELMKEEVIVRVYDLNGSKVYERRILENHSELESIDLFSLHTGVYIVELEHVKSDQSLLKRVIKM